MGRRAVVALAALAAGCVFPGKEPSSSLAQARVSADFETYAIRRVGLLPFDGRDVPIERRHELQRAFHSELSQSTPFEIVLLDEDDLAELLPSEPHRRGVYRPRTIIGLSNRYHLDAILFGTVTQERFFPPLLLTLQIDMVAAETGLVIWSSGVHLDASDPRVELRLQEHYRETEDAEAWRLALISPERFARFAAYQVARLL